MIKSLRTDHSEFTLRMKEELKINKVQVFEKELKETLVHYDEILKHKKELIQKQKNMHTIETIRLQRHQHSLEIQLTSARLEVAQRSAETDALIEKFAANTERFKTIEEDNKRLADSIAQMTQSSNGLQASIESEAIRLARLKREKEEKVAKIAEIKNRLSLIEKRKTDYFPQLEKSLLN